MAQETSKATERRLKERDRWDKVFVGIGIDVGAGDDLLGYPTYDACEGFDKPQDANKIDEYYGPNYFDFIHGSQVMEHLYNPGDFINRCLKILKPGGWIVMTVPDFDLYEKRRWPSRTNPDHKTAWSLWRQKGDHPKGVPLINVPQWLQNWPFHKEARLITTNYDYLKLDSVDQTWLREDGVECFIEILWQKPA